MTQPLPSARPSRPPSSTPAATAVVAAAAAAMVETAGEGMRDARRLESQVHFLPFFYTIPMFFYYSTNEEPKKAQEM